MFYVNIENGKINGVSELDNRRFWTEDSFQLEVCEEVYNAVLAVPERFSFDTETNEIVENTEYEAEQADEKRARLDMLSLTPSDVERALYAAKDMDFTDLQALIAQKIPTIDAKGLAIEFRASMFYRGATLKDGTRLFDAIGALLGYTVSDIDYLFVNKKLPDVDNSTEAP